MEEEDEMAVLDFKSPKGKLIKLVEQKLKKPEIDGTLGEVLDQFVQLTKDQTAFLENGIFRMNFAVDAILLERCGQYYGKRVDKLWDWLLQVHTCMIKLDESTFKHCTDSEERDARKKEVARLEERLNRGKRKKITLAQPEGDVPPPGRLYVTEIDHEDVEEVFSNKTLFPFPEEELEVDVEEVIVPFEPDSDMLDEWRTIRRTVEKENEENYDSLFVSHYHRLRYRLKHYGSLTSKEIIYDMDDPEEFNCREGRLISYHPIRQMFDDNDRCLLPDEHFTIAKLRIAYYLGRAWVIKNNVDVDAPYETYQSAWEEYEKNFYYNESRKIQNMPQSTPAQLLRFYRALARKEELAREQVKELEAAGVTNLPYVCFESVIVDSAQEGYDGIFDPYTPEEFMPAIKVTLPDLSDNQRDEELELELSNLLGNLSGVLDHRSQTPEEKLRADSGYFDGGFADDESIHDDHQSERATTGAETPFEFDRATPANKEDEHAATPALETVTEADAENGPENDLEMEHEDVTVDEFEPTSDVRDFIQQATDEQDVLYDALKDSYFNRSGYLVTIMYNKGKSSEADVSRDYTMVDYRQCFEAHKVKKATKVTPKQEENGEEHVDKKRKSDEPGSLEPFSKRRKLSRKQIEKLKKSIVRPVRELKWDYFHSLNYQPESGEGEVARVDYGPDSEDEDLLEAEDVDTSQDNNCNLSEHEDCENTDPEVRPFAADSGLGLDVSVESQEEGDHNNNHRPLGQEEEEMLEAREEVANNVQVDASSGVPVLSIADLEVREDVPEPSESQDDDMTAYEREREKVRTRVAEWKEHITPKLKRLEEREFDIHEYGSNIMSNMNVDEPTPFATLVQGKCSAEVVRYFISSLQLANTMNVEICGVEQGKLANDTFSLKLLNKERYHEHLQEYQAPSEEDLKDKLLKIKELRQQNKSKKAQGTKRARRDDDWLVETPKKVVNVSNRGGQRREDCEVVRPCSSRQAIEFDRLNSLNPSIGDVSPRRNRASIDSGFMPSCDEDFLEQFDQLQQLSGAQLQSTPSQPRPIIRLVKCDLSPQGNSSNS